jgi:hypothetical protein
VAAGTWITHRDAHRSSKENLGAKKAYVFGVGAPDVALLFVALRSSALRALRWSTE